MMKYEKRIISWTLVKGLGKQSASLKCGEEVIRVDWALSND